MKVLKRIPNILTSLRILLTFIYLYLLHNLHFRSNNRVYFTITMLLFVLICVTDLLDGKIARKLRSVSALGSILDIAADFIFITSSLIVLTIDHRIPVWVLVMVMAKFIEFLVTSYIMKNSNNGSKALFIFDYFGRIAAVNFFLIPGMTSFVYIGLNMVYINLFIYVTLILVLISSSARVIKCYNLQRISVSIGS